jgi:type I restriction enzyme M protein
MFENTFKNIDDILYRDAGADSELDYTEQTSWVLFLRYLDNLENEKADTAALEGKSYSYLLEEQYRWSSWAVPKKPDGSIDHNQARAGDDLIQFVNYELFPYLAQFKLDADNARTIEYKIGEIFSEIKNKIDSGYNLREILEYADALVFNSLEHKDELSTLYEAKIANMGNAGRNGGQFYTTRPLITAIINTVKPALGETIYDGAVGSAGFLCESYKYLKPQVSNTQEMTTLQDETLFGKEKKNLAYIIGVMNMILHGIEAPNLVHTNTLNENIRDIQEKDRFDIILANPPFGGKERPEIQQNFDIKTSETAFLFLQHFIKILKQNGRAGIVIKNTFLSNTDSNAAVSLRKHLIETCNLEMVLDMPAGTFVGAGVKTVVLFFKKGTPTKSIWYYQLDPGRNLGKTNPLNSKDFKEFLSTQESKPETERSWNLSIDTVNTETYDLGVRNPNLPEEAPLRSPKELLEEMKSLDKENQSILEEIEKIL